MENNDWDIILPCLKEMFEFEDDILWTVYFNSEMNLDKTIDKLIEISDEQNKMKSFDAISKKMITFDDFEGESKSSSILNTIKNKINSIVSKKGGKYKRLGNTLID